MTANIVSLVFNTVGVGLLVHVGYVVVRRFKGAMIALVAAALSLFFGNLDRLDTLKASLSGFEAKTREVQGVLEDAKATVALLHRLAVMTGALQVKVLAAQGRIGYVATIMSKDEQKEILLTQLKQLGLDDKEIAEVESADRPWIMWDYVIAILQPLNSNTDFEKANEYGKAYRRFLNPLTPDECEELLSKFHVDDEASKELVADYCYYLKYGKHRRPDIWRQRASGLQLLPSIVGSQR